MCVIATLQNFMLITSIHKTKGWIYEPTSTLRVCLLYINDHKEGYSIKMQGCIFAPLINSRFTMRLLPGNCIPTLCKSCLTVVREVMLVDLD